MTILQYVTAYVALQGLLNVPCDYQSAHALAMLKNTLQPHADFYFQEEQRLAQAHGEQDKAGKLVLSPQGSFRFRSPDHARCYQEEKAELDATAVPDVSQVTVRPPETITPLHVEALEKFLHFKPEACTTGGEK